jgi:hypothetical protein
MVVTLEVSQAPMSSLKVDRPANTDDRSVIAEVSQVLIKPLVLSPATT